MSLHLYELSHAYREVFDRIEDANGEIDPALEAELAAIQGPFEAKVEACCYKVREWSLTDAAIGAEIDRLKARQQAVRNGAARLKGYVLGCLEQAGTPRVETPRFTVGIQNSPPSAKWLGDPDDIPASYRREKTEVSFNAKAALDDFKAGVPLPEGVVVTRGSYLNIR